MLMALPPCAFSEPRDTLTLTTQNYALLARCSFQSLDQQKNLGDYRVLEFRRVGEGAVAAAGDDGFDGAEVQPLDE